MLKNFEILVLRPPVPDDFNIALRAAGFHALVHLIPQFLSAFSGIQGRIRVKGAVDVGDDIRLVRLSPSVVCVGQDVHRAVQFHGIAERNRPKWPDSGIVRPDMSLRIDGDGIPPPNLVLHCLQEIPHSARVAGNGNGSQHLHQRPHARHGDIFRVHDQEISLGVIGQTWDKGVRNRLRMVGVYKITSVTILLQLLFSYII